MTASAAAAQAPAPLPTSRALARRAGWGLVDQALSASTNVAVFFVVAHQVDLRGLDSFAIAFYVFTLLIGVERGGGPPVRAWVRSWWAPRWPAR